MCCFVNQGVAQQFLLAASTHHHDVCVKQLFEAFQGSFQSCAISGVASEQLYAFANSLKLFVQLHTQDVEGINSLIKYIASANPSISLPLLSARVAMTKALGLGGKDTTPKWRYIKSKALAILRSCLRAFPHRHNVLNDASRWDTQEQSQAIVAAAAPAAPAVPAAPLALHADADAEAEADQQHEQEQEQRQKQKLPQGWSNRLFVNILTVNQWAKAWQLQVNHLIVVHPLHRHLVSCLFLGAPRIGHAYLPVCKRHSNWFFVKCSVVQRGSGLRLQLPLSDLVKTGESSSLEFGSGSNMVISAYALMESLQSQVQREGSLDVHRCQLSWLLEAPSACSKDVCQAQAVVIGAEPTPLKRSEGGKGKRKKSGHDKPGLEADAGAGSDADADVPKKGRKTPTPKYDGNMFTILANLPEALKKQIQSAFEKAKHAAANGGRIYKDDDDDDNEEMDDDIIAELQEFLDVHEPANEAADKSDKEDTDGNGNDDDDGDEVFRYGGGGGDHMICRLDIQRCPI